MLQINFILSYTFCILESIRWNYMTLIHREQTGGAISSLGGKKLALFQPLLLYEGNEIELFFSR